MLAILNPGESITAVMSAAAATTNPVYSSEWQEKSSHDQEIGSLNGTTAVTIVAAPRPGPRDVLNCLIYNIDSATVTITIAKVVSGTSYTLSKIAIPVNACLQFSDAGLSVVNTSGEQLTTVSALTGTIGTATTNVTATEIAGVVQKTSLSLVDLSVTVGNTTGVSFGGTKIYDFPEGRILVLGSVIGSTTFDLTDAGNSTPIAGADGGDIAVGTTVAGDGTLTAADVDLIPSTSIDPISSGVTGAALAASAQFDGTTTAKDAYFNIIIDDADVANGASDVLLVTATVTLFWILLGDF